MKRREFITLLGGVGVYPFAAPAQVRDRVHRVGVLFPASEMPGARLLVEAMAKHGFIEGRNLAFDFRSANGQPDLLPVMMRRWHRHKPPPHT